MVFSSPYPQLNEDIVAVDSKVITQPIMYSVVFGGDRFLSMPDAGHEHSRPRSPKCMPSLSLEDYQHRGRPCVDVDPSRALASAVPGQKRRHGWDWSIEGSAEQSRFIVQIRGRGRPLGVLSSVVLPALARKYIPVGRLRSRYATR